MFHYKKDNMPLKETLFAMPGKQCAPCVSGLGWAWKILLGILIVAGIFYFMRVPLKRELFGPFPEAMEQPDLKDEKPLKNFVPPPPATKAVSFDPSVGVRTLDSNLSESIPPNVQNWKALAPPDADLRGQNFLTPQQYIGKNTVKKNVSYDIRKVPTIEKRANVSPWMNSTFEMEDDQYRRPLEG
jgi:hypothetical protein